MQSDQHEPFLGERLNDFLLRKNLESGELNDVELHGCDGVVVPAIKFMFLMHSDVFRRMLQGPFEEGKSSVVKLGYPGAIVEMIRDFVYFNKIQVLCENEAEIRKLVQLIYAADYYNVDALAKHARERASTMIVSKPCLACAIFDEVGLDPFDTSKPQEARYLISLARTTIYSDPEKSLLPVPEDDAIGGGIKCISFGKKVLEPIIDQIIPIDKQFLKFQCLDKWASDSRDDNSFIVAQSLLEKCIVLSKIHPWVLADTVSKSPLVSKDLLWKEFLGLLKASSGNGNSLSGKRNRRRPSPAARAEG